MDVKTNRDYFFIRFSIVDEFKSLDHSAMVKTRYPIQALAVLVAVLALWSSAFAGIRAGLTGYSPGQLALFRFLIASAVLAMYAGIVHFRRPALRDLPWLVITGLFGIAIYNLALNWGQTRVSAGAASLLIASTPIWTALLAMIGLGEHVTPAGWGGILMSFVGVGIIAKAEGEGLYFSPQALVILIAAISGGIYNALVKHFVGRYSALECTAYSIWFGTVLMAPWGAGLAHTVRTAPLNATLAIVYLGVFPAATAYLGWAYLLSHGPAGRTSTFLYLTPVLAIGIAWLWLGEIPKVLSVIGGAIALCGVILVHIWGHGKAEKDEATELEQK
jgi:drug/metabolite transporter (DMT)-like permease